MGRESFMSCCGLPGEHKVGSAPSAMRERSGDHMSRRTDRLPRRMLRNGALVWVRCPRKPWRRRVPAQPQLPAQMRCPLRRQCNANEPLLRSLVVSKERVAERFGTRQPSRDSILAFAAVALYAQQPGCKIPAAALT